MENKQLPEKWAIRINKENREILKKWAGKRAYYCGWYENQWLYYLGKENREFSWNTNEKPEIHYPEYQYFKEIILEEFKKHILKEEIMEEKKIIGYKLVKPEYHDAVKKITGYINWDYVNLKDEKGKHYISVKFDTECYKSLRNAGVLDLWFEPVFEEELKVDDWVYFIKSFDSAPRGHLAKITRVTEDSVYQGAKWIGYNPKVRNGGAFRWNGNGYKLGIDFRKATKEEIEEYNRPKLPIINGYSGRMEGDYIRYGSNCAKFHKNFFLNLYKVWIEKDWSQTRDIMSIKLDSGVELTIDQIKQIVEYINNN